MTPRRFELIAAAVAAGSLLGVPLLAEDSRTGSAGTGAAGQGSVGPGLAPQIDDMMHPTHLPDPPGATDSDRTEAADEESNRDADGGAGTPSSGGEAGSP